MRLSDNERREIVHYLTTNCDSWKSAGDESILNGLPDDKLMALKESATKNQQAIAVANAAVHGFSEGRQQFRINPVTGHWEKRTLNGNPTSNRMPMEEEEEEEVEDMEVEDDMEEEEEEYVPTQRKRKPVMPAVNNKPRTTDDWFREAPLEVQEERRYAQQIVNREKDQIIAQLLVNVSEAERPAHRERLRTRSLEDLHNDLALVPLPPTQEEINRATGGRRPAHNKRRTAEDDMLVPPAINWEPVSEKDAAPQEDRPMSANRQYIDDHMTEEDELAQLPPRLRSVVQNSLQIEQREKQKLISELTANMTDDDAQAKLVRRLSSKTLEELKDLTSLVPSKPPTRPNFFGASAPAPLLSANRSEELNDVLIPPKMDWKTDNNSR